ncbi:MAG: DUF1501 domain-containing protein [Nocardioides sp.]
MTIETLTPTEPADDLQTCGCPDFTLSRRRLLGTVAASTGALAASTMFGDAYRQVAYGAPGGSVVVVLSLRGGADGLSLIVPRGADHDVLKKARPDLVIPADRLVGGDTRFGLHPGFAPLLPMWSAGAFGAVHGVALPNPNRSHFEATFEMEDADPGSTERRGWINRMIPADALPEQHLQFGTSLIPVQLAGDSPSLAIGSVGSLNLPTLYGDQRPNRALKKVWKGKGELNKSVRRAIAVTKRQRKLAGTDIEKIAQTYPEGGLRYVLANTAATTKADIGARVITIDYGNWDTHEAQGTPSDKNGLMNLQVDHLARSLARFFEDLGPDAGKVTVITMTEFGRRVAQNGTGAGAGTDHGYGSAMLLLGAGVNGGKVSGVWQGLSSLEDGDVRKYNDYRSVVWEVMQARLREASGRQSAIFPGLSYKPTGAMR